MEDTELIFDPLPTSALAQTTVEGLNMFNVAATGIGEWHPANFFLKSARGECIGGTLGTIWGGWLHVSHLWVAARVRGRGYGARLLTAAEEFAREKGCGSATLETFSFQARPFYEKHGYRVFGHLDDCPPGHVKFYLRKSLS